MLKLNCCKSNAHLVNFDRLSSLRSSHSSTLLSVRNVNFLSSKYGWPESLDSPYYGKAVLLVDVVSSLGRIESRAGVSGDASSCWKFLKQNSS